MFLNSCKTKWSHTGGGRYERVDSTSLPECQGPALLAARGIAVWGARPLPCHATITLGHLLLFVLLFLRERETALFEDGEVANIRTCRCFLFGFHHPASKPKPTQTTPPPPSPPTARAPHATRLWSHIPPIRVQSVKKDESDLFLIGIPCRH